MNTEGHGVISLADQKFEVTVSRLPDSVLDELENQIAQIHDEYDLDPDIMQSFQVLLIGYVAAWDALEKRSTV